MRGSRIYKVIDAIDTIIIAKDSSLNVLNDITESIERNNSILSIEFEKMALERVKQYLVAVFEVNKISSDVFTKKMFKGARISETLTFIDFMAKDCLKVLNDMEQKKINPLVYSDDHLKIYLTSQVNAYRELKNILYKGFVQNSKDENFDFLSAWVAEIYEEVGLN